MAATSTSTRPGVLACRSVRPWASRSSLKLAGARTRSHASIPVDRRGVVLGNVPHRSSLPATVVPIDPGIVRDDPPRGHVEATPLGGGAARRGVAGVEGCLAALTRRSLSVTRLRIRCQQGEDRLPCRPPPTSSRPSATRCSGARSSGIYCSRATPVEHRTHLGIAAWVAFAGADVMAALVTAGLVHLGQIRA